MLKQYSIKNSDTDLDVGSIWGHSALCLRCGNTSWYAIYNRNREKAIAIINKPFMVYNSWQNEEIKEVVLWD